MKRVPKQPTDIIAERKIESNTVAGTDSLVAKYEVLMKENEAERLSEERSVLIFKVFDNLLPQLGVFKPLLSTIRDELYDFVFSDEHHTARASKMTDLSGSRSQTAASSAIDRIPHYVLLKKLVQTRDNVSDDLQSQVDVLQERLFAKQVEFEEALATMANRNEEESNLQATIVELEKKVSKQEQDINSLMREMKEKETKSEQTQEELNRCCDMLQEDCNEKDEEIKYLQTYKDGYERLHEAFLDQNLSANLPGVDRFTSYEPKEAVMSTKKEHIISNIKTSEQLEEQVLTVMNTMIEQYDVYLEEQKAELASKTLLNNPDIIASRKIEREIDEADQELWSMQERFKGTMKEINEELSLLRQHNSMLEEQLAAIEADENKDKGKKKQKSSKARLYDKSPADPITLDEVKKMSLDPSDYVEEDYENNPFIPHERVLSKYAVMLYYSQDGGNNYYMHQDCRYCESCHEKTIACPHKLLGEKKILAMPHRVTHIKLKRPSVKILRNIEEHGRQLKAPPTASTAVIGVSPTKRSAGTRSERSVQITGRTSPILPTSGTSGAKFVQMKNSLQTIWDDYAIRTEMVRSIGRTISLERTMSCYEQFLAYIIYQDEHASEEDGYGSVMDNLFQYFSERYLVEEAQFAAVHDFLSAVILHATEHRDIQVFAHSLVGNIDFSACRYILMLTNYIETVEWQDVEDFRAFTATIYPFILDEDLESMQMGFVSFSENKVSKLHVYEYILHLVLKGREPRIQDLEQQLMQYPSREAGVMNDEEFSEAVDHILQVPDEKRRKSLFAETLLLQQNEQSDSLHVHVSKLACILAYLQILEQKNKLDSVIHDVIASSRPTHEESLGVHGHVVPVDPSIHLLTMQHVENLSFNVARREKCRKDRMETQNDDAFFA